MPKQKSNLASSLALAALLAADAPASWSKEPEVPNPVPAKRRAFGAPAPAFSLPANADGTHDAAYPVFSPAGAYLAERDATRRLVRVWDVNKKELVGQIEFKEKRVGGGFYAFAPDKTTLFVQTEAGTISEWDFATGKVIRKLEHEGSRAVEFEWLDVSPTGGGLLAMSRNALLHWDLKTAQAVSLVSPLRSKRLAVNVRAYFAKGGAEVLAFVENNRLAVFDVKTAALKKEVDLPLMGLACLTPDRERFATVTTLDDEGGTTRLRVRVWGTGDKLLIAL